MAKRERTLTLYFDNDDPLYNTLMGMNKFSRAEYVRAAIQEAIDNGMAINVSVNGISVSYVDDKREFNQNNQSHSHTLLSHPQQSISENMDIPNNKDESKNDIATDILDNIDIPKNSPVTENENITLNSDIDLDENNDPFSI